MGGGGQVGVKHDRAECLNGIGCFIQAARTWKASSGERQEGRADRLCVLGQPRCVNTPRTQTLERLPAPPTILRIKARLLADAPKSPRGLASPLNPIPTPHTTFPASYTPGSWPPRSSRTCKEPSCRLACVSPFLIASPPSLPPSRLPSPSRLPPFLPFLYFLHLLSSINIY